MVFERRQDSLLHVGRFRIPVDPFSVAVVIPFCGRTTLAIYLELSSIRKREGIASKII